MLRAAVGIPAAVGALAPAPTLHAAPGESDATFGNGGRVLTQAGERLFAETLLLQPDGMLVAGGYTGTGFVESGVLARYRSDGALDTASVAAS